MEQRPIPVSQRPVPGNIELDFAERTSDLSIDLAVASIVVLPPNRHRTAAWLINNSAVVIYLGLGRPATATSGIRLNAAGGAFEINFTNLYRGEIQAISASGTGNGLLIVELESRYAR
ncbi:unnamed protein product [marine sediment metagenome]|uniref:Uncharacterized protein n=1 Tax=marine sediment metagenome TaxID=412755 RepID=X1TDI3_9ZZZZ